MKTGRMHIQFVVFVVLGLFLALTGSIYAGSDTKKQEAPARPQPAAKTGEQVFMMNCSRCHVPPMSLSPRITGTVIMHMRVRARLSRQDENLLLKYLAP
jgi:cytochrome c5